MRAAIVLFGILAAIVVGGLVLLTVDQTVGLVAAAATLVVAIYGATAAPRGIRTGLLFVMIGLFVGSTAFLTIQIIPIIQAFSGTSGPVDAADPVALASAEEKIAGATGDGGFRLEMREDEMEAVLQDALGSEQDTPLRKVDVDIVDGAAGQQGRIDFVGLFKEGGISAEGSITAKLESGAVQIDILKVEVGAIQLPGIAKGAIEDLLSSVTDLNQALKLADADVQSVQIANDRVVITGTQPAGSLLTSETLLDNLAAQAAAVGQAANPPPERLGPGRVNATFENGSTYYVALGDSLAANVGVTNARDGYVSRFHSFLEGRDGATYGLRNFGISGETTGTLIRTGQLDEAIAFIQNNDIRYVTIDIGANDLLGHLGSPDCSESLEAPACAQRLQSAFDGYRTNMEQIFDRLQAAAPQATILFLTAYNPFSLGFADAITFEAQSNITLVEFNDIAVELARARGIVVANGFGPMKDTAASTTHMLDSPPDIHPVPIGYDILASALADALGL